jgi:5-methylcytosine-specific restriction protein A
MNPLCVLCKADGRLTPATVVDHKTPHKGNKGLFYDVDNFQALCKQCHDSKTAKEDGGFSNKIRV